MSHVTLIHDIIYALSFSYLMVFCYNYSLIQNYDSYFALFLYPDSENRDGILVCPIGVEKLTEITLTILTRSKLPTVKFLE